MCTLQAEWQKAWRVKTDSVWLCLVHMHSCPGQTLDFYDDLFRTVEIREGGRATKWENRGSEAFCTPTSRKGKSFHAPTFTPS